MERDSVSTMGAAPVRLSPERCLNARHHRASCVYCVKGCPAGALSIEGRTVALDADVCTGCGICLVACPTEVFTSRVWSERNILGNLSELPETSVELVCAKHPEADCEVVRPGVLKVRVCLAAFSPGLLFEAGLTKKVDLRVDACETCEQGCARALIENSAALANSWLDSVGEQGRISLSNEPASLVTEEKVKTRRFRFRKAVRTDEERCSRRDFLTGFARDGSSLFAAFLGVDPEKAGLGNPEEYSHSPKRPHIHRWREALSKAWPANPKDDASAALWAQISVSDACTGCGVCEQFCPDRALKSHTSGGYLRRTFTPGLCADCALCALACPSEAIMRSYANQSHPFEAQVVHEAKMERCPRCHAPAIKSTDGLCHWCASEPSIEPLLGQARDLLSDAALAVVPVHTRS